ncbi:hypothetical protein HK405_011283, partial [Cladochytrium tenue]
PTSSVTASDANIAAFKREFKDPDNYVNRLYEDLERYAKAWERGGYYFPGASIIQTSGSGKSRAMRELAKHGVYVVYCSFMKGDASGFPRRSDIAEELLRPETSFLAYFLACGGVVDNYIKDGVEPDKVFEQTIGSLQRKFWNEVSENMKAVEQDAKKKEKEAEKARLDEVNSSKASVPPPEASVQISKKRKKPVGSAGKRSQSVQKSANKKQ